MPPPLTPQETARAEALEIFYLWYEDQFHYAGDRQGFAVAVCLTKPEADAELKNRARPLAAGGDGYEIVGPCSLADERRIGVVREVLRRIDARQPGPVPIPPELW